MFADSVGGDDLERPPNGHATPVALERCLRMIPEAIHEVVLLQRAAASEAAREAGGVTGPAEGLGISMVQFGQGLIEAATDPTFEAAIEAVSPGTTIMQSMSTFASEEAAGGPMALGGQQCAQQ